MSMTKFTARSCALILIAAAGLTYPAFGQPENESASSRFFKALAAGSEGVPITSTTLADIAGKVAPAIVHISTEKPAISMSSMRGQGFPFNLPFGDFEMFFNGQRIDPRDPNAPIKMPKRQSSGSGFIIRPDGYILTNSHVVRGAPKITVTLNDKRTFENAKVVGSDPESDLAVLKIEAKDLPHATMGSSSAIRPGEFVIAVGSPMGLDHTVTFGIVSAVGRAVTDVNRTVKFIQTDAAINPGNSGGPLLNLKGEVVGVNNAILARAQNIGFSIPIDTAKAILDDLVAGRTPERPWLGIEMAELTETWRRSLGLDETINGVLVSRVVNGSPAHKSGLEGGDIILKIDGRDIKEMGQVQQMVREHKIKDTLNFLVLRNGARKALAATIGTYPSATVAKSLPQEDESDE